MLRILILMVASWLVIPAGLCASFDCKRATSDTETVICKNWELSRLDGELARRYQLKLASSKSPQELRTEQRTWLLSVRDQCKTPECLRAAYQERIRSLAPAIGALKLGKDFGTVQIVAKPTFPGCELSIINSAGTTLQKIRVEYIDCPLPKTFGTFDPNGDGYEDFVIITAHGAGPFPDMGAWLFRPEKGQFERDRDFPGGWPVNDKCTELEFRTGGAAIGYRYESKRYCYSRNVWTE